MYLRHFALTGLPFETPCCSSLCSVADFSVYF